MIGRFYAHVCSFQLCYSSGFGRVVEIGVEVSRAAEAEELDRRPLDGNHKTCLTQTGLLMEGLGPLVPSPQRLNSSRGFIDI